MLRYRLFAKERKWRNNSFVSNFYANFLGDNDCNRSIRSFHSSTIKNAAVMSFGDGSHSALGFPNSLTGLSTDVYEPTRVPNLPSDIFAVAVGHYHSLAVTSGGELWAWGRNNEAQLGRGLLSLRNTWNEPKRVDGLERVNVRAASASGVISAAIGDDGSLWVWGKSKRGQLGLGKDVIEALIPSKVDALSGERVVKVSFGWGHALALTDDGKLFGWGYSADGRIGNVGIELEQSPLDSNVKTPINYQQSSTSKQDIAETLVLEAMEKEGDMPLIWEPRLVNELRNIEVADIACGLDHSLVLCRNGILLSSGSNVYGQLGRSNQDLGIFPVELTFCPTSIASGLGHSLAVCAVKSTDGQTDEPNVISWGWNRSSQLGRAGPETVPTVVDGLSGETPVSVSGGRAHSLALTSKGEVWVWGCGKNGRLGLGCSVDEVEPVLVDGLEDCEVLQAMAGFDHNLILVAK